MSPWESNPPPEFTKLAIAMALLVSAGPSSKSRELLAPAPAVTMMDGLTVPAARSVKNWSIAVAPS